MTGEVTEKCSEHGIRFCVDCYGYKSSPTLPKAGTPAVEAVNHPKHYNSHPSGVECIDVVRHMNFNLGNVIKYLWRADHKNASIEDLKKARWYPDDEIKRLEGAAK